MTAAQPHPLRCETCNNDDCDYSREAEAYMIEQENLAIVDIIHNEWGFTSRKGCASHSSAKDAEMVLDELMARIEKCWFSVDVGDPDGNCCVVATDDLERWISKLRERER